MANVGVSAVKLIDSDGDALDDGDGRLKVNASGDSFGTFINYPDFAVETGTAQALNHANHTGVSIADAKEILIQTDDANTGFVMVGYSAGTTLAGSVGGRAGIKLNGGETLVISWSTFSTVYLIASASTQYVNVAYFK